MIKRALTYFVIITCVLYLFRYVCYQGLLKQQKGVYAKLRNAFLEGNGYSLLILGSSRAEMHYNTPLLDSLTGENCFNLGLRGAMPRVAFGALKAYLANSSAPKYLLYEVDYHIADYKQESLDDLTTYFPFLGNATLRTELNKTDNRMSWFHYTPYLSLPYTGFDAWNASLLAWAGKISQGNKIYSKGFLQDTYPLYMNYIPSKKKHVYFHPQNRQYLDSIIGICKQNGIRLTFVTSPIFAGAALDLNNKKDMIRQVNNIASINKLSYYDLSSPEYCRQREYFLDNQHMKYRGACFFTEKIASVFNNKIRCFSLKEEQN